jgi:hypothetical protein
MNKRAGLILAGGLLFLLSSQAATIDWTTNAITGYASDVVTNGTLLEAVNAVGNGVTTSPVINGVTFTATSTLLGGSYTADPWTPVAEDTEYDKLLSTIDYQATGTGAFTLKTLDGLTVGQQYIIQIWHADSAAAGVSRTMTYTGTGQNVLNGVSYAVGTFIADATTQDLVVTASQSGPRLTAYQLRADGEYVAPTNPIIELSPSTLSFGYVYLGNTNNLTLSLKNAGGGSLVGTATVMAPFFIESGSTYSLTNNQEQIISVQFIPEEEGVFSGSLAFTGGDGTNISLSGTGVVPGTNDPITIESLLNQMTNRSERARFPDPSFRLINFSSYNRDSDVGPPESGVSATSTGWFANNDFNGKYLYTTTEYGNGTEYVMVDHQAPGAIVRFWTPWRSVSSSSLNDYVRIYLDGATTPVIEGNMLTLFDGTDLIPYPFGHSSLRSAVSFFPIPYAERCVVTLDRSPFFYIYTCREYDPGTQVKTFTMDDFDAVADLVSTNGVSLLDPASSVPKGTETSTTAILAAGDETPLVLPAGGNAVHEFTVKVSSAITPQLLRSLIVKAEFDGLDTIWCPLSDFFGSGVGLHPFEGWYRSVESNGTFSCRWVMPYQADGQLSLENLSGSSVDVTMSAITDPWTWDDRSLYFHTAWRSQYPLPTRPWSDWNYVTVSGGRGVYVGDTLTIWNPVTSWWGEGDHKIWVDGDTFPSMFGTGTEDYYGYSWGGRSTDFYEHPFHAQVQCNVYDKLNRNPDSPGYTADTYGYSVETRTRALDGIVFTNYLQLDMEVWHGTDVDMDYAVASHWYADVDTADNRSPDTVSVLQTVWDETSTNSALYVSVPEVDFGFAEIGAVTSVTITVQNRGGATLSGTASADAPFSIVSGGSYSLGTADTQAVVVAFSPTTTSVQTGLLSLTDGGGASVELKGCGYTDVTTGVEDSDADGLPDLWESKWVSNLTDLSGEGDFDGDGVSDADEYASGSDPLDRDDFFVISDFAQTVNGPRVTWSTESGKSYTIERTTELITNSWTTLATGLTSGVWIDTSSAAQGQSHLFYRVRTE